MLAAYVAVLHPRGLLDRAPTVLGLRTLTADGREASTRADELAALVLREVLEEG